MGEKGTISEKKKEGLSNQGERPFVRAPGVIRRGLALGKGEKLEGPVRSPDSKRKDQEEGGVARSWF